MIPFFVFLFGLTVIVICLLVLKKTGGAAWKRKMSEAIEEDKETFKSDDKIG